MKELGLLLIGGGVGGLIMWFTMILLMTRKEMKDDETINDYLNDNFADEPNSNGRSTRSGGSTGS